MDSSDIGATRTLVEEDVHVRPHNLRILEFDLVVASIDNEESSTSLEERGEVDVVPKLGMEFESDDHAYEFYSRYATLTGFIVRKNYLNKSKVNGEVVSRRFSCSKEGFRQKDNRDINVKKRRKESRTGCLAQMTISRQPNGKYSVIHFEAKHNHDIVIPHGDSILPAQRRSPVSQAPVALEDSSRRQSRSGFQSTGGQVEGRDNCSCLPVDYKNNLQSKRRREMKEGEAKSFLDYLQKRQLEDSSFFYAVKVDIDDQITNIFWADATMVVEYGYFGDVVCFDTTYKTNKDCRPFALFIGVNHHKQMVIFGAALLYDETIESFEWLFQTFIATMSGQKPKTILTGQDATIIKAINSVLPETYHRICVWHMYQDALVHLNHAFNGLGSFAKDFSSCIYDHEDEEDFINAWKGMLDAHNLRKNEWLKGIFNIREKWAIPYGRHSFYGDLKSTQLSDGFNGNLRDYVKAGIDMLQFFEHFERVVADQRCKELEASYDIFERLPTLMGNVVCLKHARDVYTPEVFEVFQQEYEKCLNIVVNQYSSSGSTFEYKVSIYGQSREHMVTFNSSNDTVACNCMKFEFFGFLCSHALKVLDQRNIKVVPTQYILKRWTKDARVGSVRDSHGCIIQEDPMLAAANYYRTLCHKAAKIAAMAAESEEAYRHVKRRFDEMMHGLEKILNIKPHKDTQLAENFEPVDEGGDAHFRDESGFTGASSIAACNFNISSNLLSSPDYLMLHNDVPVSKTPRKSSGPESIPTAKMCTACKSPVSSTWRYGPKGPKTLCNACGLRYKKEHIKLWETTIPFPNPKSGSVKRRKSSTENEF